MKSLIFFIICIHFLKIQCATHKLVVNRNLDKYLSKRSESVHETIAQTNQTASRKDTYKIEMFETDRYNSRAGPLDGPRNFFKIHTLGITFLIARNKLVYFDVVNRRNIERQIATLIHNRDIEYVRSTEYNKLGILLTVTDREMHIYGFTTNKTYFVHTILTPYAVDAQLFVNSGNLYLIIANNKGDNMMETSIYKWLGTNFDEEKTVPTLGAFMITTFTYDLSEIIIILQHLPNKRVMSTVLKFNSGKIKKIQHLPTIHPVHIEKYVYKNTTHVIIFQQAKVNVIYTWDENASKLAMFSKLKTPYTIKLSGVLEADTFTAVFLPVLERIQVYFANEDGLRLEKELSYSSNCSVVLDLSMIKEGNVAEIFVTCLTGPKELSTFDLLFALHINPKTKFDDENVARSCLQGLDNKIYDQKKILREFHESLSQEKIGKGNFTEEDTKTILGAPNEEIKLEGKLDHVSERLGKILTTLNNYQNFEGDDIIINGSVEMKGLLEAEILSGIDVNLKEINNHKWVPEQWLMYKQPQTISGPVKIRNIVTKDLETSSEDHLFRDMLRKNGNQEIRGKVTIKSLTANEIFAEKINNVPLEDVYSKNNPRVIYGLKTFKNLKAREAKIDLLNKIKPEKFLPLIINPSSRTMFDDHLEVENLSVQLIGDVHWDTFKNSVFRVGETKEINGSLTFPEVKTKNLTLKTLSGIKLDDLLTTSTDQTIISDIQFNRIFAENINTNTTNNVKLAEAVQFGDERPVEGHVKFDKLYVTKDLELIGDLDESFFLINGDHIIGTNESDFLQKYTGKVTIKGNLYVNNITLQPGSEMLVSGEEMNPNICDVYWTKSSNQIIPVRFQAQKGVRVPHLQTEMINNVRVRDYMLINNGGRPTTSFHFTDVTISGDVVLNDKANNIPDFKEINKNAVKTNGSFFIKGKKTYTGTLQVKNLATDILDGIIVYDALTKNTSGTVTGKKKFEKMIVKQNLTSGLISVDRVNKTDLRSLIKEVIYIDQPQDLNKLNFKNISVDNLYVSLINDLSFNDYVSNLEKLNTSEKINSLRVEGNVGVQNVQNLSNINGIEYNQLQNNALKIDKSGAARVNMKFLGNLKVNNLVTASINGVNLMALESRLLQKNLNQTIRAPYRFSRIKANDITTPKINDISLKNLVDVSGAKNQTIYAPHGLEFTSAKLMKSLEADETSPCDMEEALSQINHPQPQNWHTVDILGNVTLMDTENILYRVFEKTVNTNATNVIHAPVNFTSHIMAANVFTRRPINGINVGDIIEDAVLESSTEQVIAGRKIFPTMEVSNVSVMKNTDSPVVNEMDIPEINRAIVRNTDIPQGIIRGKKTFFRGLQTERFYSETVADIDTENIVSLEDPRIIPSALFDRIKIENDLNVTRLNQMPFYHILQNRLLTDGVDEQAIDGIYYFENIVAENMETPLINNVNVDDVVFDIDQQDIFSSKRFLKSVKIRGNVQTEYINEVDLEKAHQNSVVTGQDFTVNGSITVLRPAVVKGFINVDNINGYPVASVKDILYKGTTRYEAQKIHSLKSDIIQIIKNIHQVKDIPGDYMYLEKSDLLQISVPNSVNAKTITSKGYVLMHITGAESGEYCGLPTICTCPIQYSLEITPEHSVAVYPNKDLQRTFSYDDDNMIVHFITNSISTDSTCRSGEARILNEVSMISWSTLSTKNETGAFYQYDKLISGYISGVEFFTLDGKTYAIIARYYDPTTDSHDLDCIVIKFSEDKSKAKEIQRITTSGVWSIYLFHTAQGVTLIIGNMGSMQAHFEEEETSIYRFDAYNQQFQILRKIPSYGSTMASGVVLGADSLIILAHKSAPLQVLKYDHHFDNYYFYQSFELDSHVQGISVFYTGGFGISDAYLCIVTENENYFIYSFQFIEGWKLESSGELDGLRNLIPFNLNNQPYLFAPSRKMSSLLTVVKHGSV